VDGARIGANHCRARGVSAPLPGRRFADEAEARITALEHAGRAKSAPRKSPPAPPRPEMAHAGRAGFGLVALALFGLSLIDVTLPHPGGELLLEFALLAPFAAAVAGWGLGRSVGWVLLLGAPLLGSQFYLTDQVTIGLDLTLALASAAAAWFAARRDDVLALWRSEPWPGVIAAGALAACASVSFSIEINDIHSLALSAAELVPLAVILLVLSGSLRAWPVALALTGAFLLSRLFADYVSTDLEFGTSFLVDLDLGLSHPGALLTGAVCAPLAALIRTGERRSPWVVGLTLAATALVALPADIAQAALRVLVAPVADLLGLRDSGGEVLLASASPQDIIVITGTRISGLTGSALALGLLALATAQVGGRWVPHTGLAAVLFKEGAERLRPASAWMSLTALALVMLADLFYAAIFGNELDIAIGPLIALWLSIWLLARRASG